MAEVEQGISVPRTKQTVADLLAYWMEHYVEPNVTAVTRENYTYTLKHLLDSLLAGILAQELKPEQVTRWYTTKRKARCGARTLQQCHMRLSQAYKLAMRLELVSRNPMDKVPSPKLQAKSMDGWEQHTEVADRLGAAFTAKPSDAHGITGNLRETGVTGQPASKGSQR